MNTTDLYGIRIHLLLHCEDTPGALQVAHSSAARLHRSLQIELYHVYTWESKLEWHAGKPTGS